MYPLVVNAGQVRHKMASEGMKEVIVSFRMVQFKPGIFWKKNKTVPDPPPDDGAGIHKGRKYNVSRAYSAYIPLGQSIVAHWNLVNTALGGTTATDMKLRGTLTVAAFTTKVTAYGNAVTDVSSKDNSVQGASQDLLTAKTAISAFILQGRLMMRAVLKTTTLPAMMPNTPQVVATPAAVYQIATEFADVWTRANALSASSAFTPPLIIGGQTLAQFQTTAAALLTKLNTSTTAIKNAQEARAHRNVLLADMITDMVDYRATVLGLLGPTHELATTIPNVSPNPGHTPAAVNLSGVWNATDVKASLSWTASADGDLKCRSDGELLHCTAPTAGVKRLRAAAPAPNCGLTGAEALLIAALTLRARRAASKTSSQRRRRAGI